MNTKCAALAGLVFLALASSVPACMADEADVVDARATKHSGGTWSFAVTVRHDDTGWDHYADKWDIVAPGGTVLATRILHHPHENEQPFTRSLDGITIPSGVTSVTIRAHDKLHGYGGTEIRLDLE